MKIEEVKKRHGEKSTVSICIRITPKMSKWMDENDCSPTAIFKGSLTELGFKE